MTDRVWSAPRIFCLALAIVAAGCGESVPATTPTRSPGQSAERNPVPDLAPDPSTGATATGVAGTSPAPPMEKSLGVTDRGVFSDLDAQVQIALPADLTPERARALVDAEHKLLVLYRDDWPVKVYPLAGDAELAIGDRRLPLRPGDRAELAPMLAPARVTDLAAGAAPPPGDSDRDGIPDPLDVLVGGYKTALDAAPYGGGYIQIDYPNGDIPRGQGVCTDVVIRAARNAGLDLQSELQKDVRRSRRSYPMIKRPNAHIDHRRVKTILPYFLRHWDRRTTAFDDAADPLRPGDVVFFDTFPGKPGPDHIGIVSDRMGPNGLPLVINSWTDGFKTSEMDLLPTIPVTHRFRYQRR